MTTYLHVKDSNGSSIQRLRGKNEKPIKVHTYNVSDYDKIAGLVKDKPDSSQVTSTGQTLTIDMVVSKQNLQGKIMDQRRRKSFEDNFGKKSLKGKNVYDKDRVITGGFIAFWRSVDQAVKSQKVP